MDTQIDSKGRVRQVSLSNRRETSVLSTLSQVGLDRLSVSFPVSDFDESRENWSSVQEQRSNGELSRVSYSKQIDAGRGVNVFVGVQMPSKFAKIEFNPSRFNDPDGYSLASFDATWEAFVRAVELSRSVVTPAEGDNLARYRLKRLDVARDFVSPIHPSSLIRSLAPIPRKWARKNLVHADPARNGAQTLLVGSGAGAVRCYDKNAETKGAVPEGTIRVEIEARGDWCDNYGGMTSMADLTQENVEMLGRNRFDWSAMGVEVKSSKGVIQAVRDSDLTPREQTMFLGWLLQQASGDAYMPSNKTLAKYRKIQRELNVAFGADVSEILSLSFSTRIDWETGEVITRVS